ncbi:MAG: DUF5106 domain-containing protein, partial [Alistipes sp.]|nr:DUF5106 domain-containing protein [Alistipes sp.]
MYKNILIVAIATLLFSSKLCAQDMGAGFVLPTIPETITQPEQRADYLALHYWENLDMADQQMVESDNTQLAFANFISILPYSEHRGKAFANLWAKSYPYRDAFYHMLHLAEQYLYDVGSPQRNEEYYIEALEAIAESADINDIDKISVIAQLELLKRNRIGDIASDFKFVDKQGEEHTLSEYRAEYLLLLFTSADCEDCKRLKRDIDANTRLWMMLRRGTLAIVAITITDDESAWMATTTPERWIDGWDKAQLLESSAIYDLTTKPRLYLLDRDHKVVLKNTTPIQVEEYIS